MIFGKENYSDDNRIINIVFPTKSIRNLRGFLVRFVSVEIIEICAITHKNISL
jgi:hypothetical protein